MAKSAVERAIAEINRRTMVNAFNQADSFVNSEPGIYRVPASLTLAEQDRVNREATYASNCRKVPMFRELLCRHLVMQTRPCKQCGRTFADAQEFAVGMVDAIFGDGDDN